MKAHEIFVQDVRTISQEERFYRIAQILSQGLSRLSRERCKGLNREGSNMSEFSLNPLDVVAH